MHLDIHSKITVSSVCFYSAPSSLMKQKRDGVGQNYRVITVTKSRVIFRLANNKKKTYSDLNIDTDVTKTIYFNSCSVETNMFILRC